MEKRMTRHFKSIAILTEPYCKEKKCEREEETEDAQQDLREVSLFSHHSFRHNITVKKGKKKLPTVKANFASKTLYAHLSR